MADQQHETKVEFRFNCDDPVSTLEMKKTVTSSDKFVQWEVTLSMVPHIHPTVKDHYEVTALRLQLSQLRLHLSKSLFMPFASF